MLRSIIVWRGGLMYKKLTAHQAIVWALATLPNGYIVSGSSDCTIKIWNADYQLVKNIPTKFYVRCLTTLPGLGFLSAGSNESLVLWSYDGEQISELRSHKDTVYSVTTLPSGEIVSGSEDCTVVVWNGDQAEQSLATPAPVMSVAALDNGDIIAACHDKVIRVFTRDPARFLPDDALAQYMESVMNAAAAAAETEAAKTQRQMVNGVAYDHVIQVDLAEGQPTIPLGYNDDEPSVDAAERFLVQNNISAMYLDEITKFIDQTKQSAQISQQQTAAAPYIDPFRDSAVPSQYGTNLVPSSVGNQSRPANTTSAAAPKSQQASPAQIFASAAPITITTGQSGLILNKLKQLNEEIEPSSKLNVDELDLLDSLSAKLNSPQGSVGVKFTSSEVNNLISCMSKWPQSKHFPFLDLTRLALLYPDFGAQVANTLLPVVLPDLEPSNAAFTLIMALRTLNNAFAVKQMHAELEGAAETVLENLASLVNSTANAAIPVLAVSLLRNYATLLSPKRGDARIQIISVALEGVLLDSSAKPDIVHLALYSIGNLLSNDAQLILVAKDMGMQEAVKVYATSSDANVKQAALALNTLFTVGISK